jgi:transposase
MYLRTSRRQRADGTTVEYYQLAENVWDVQRGCSVTKIVYNFGRADQVDPDALRRLARSILRVVGGSDVAAGDGGAVEGLRLLDSKPFGGVWVLEHIWKELGVDVALKKHAPRRATGEAHERALFAMVANRALAPYSKLYCYEQWLREEVYLPSAADLSLSRYYRAMDFLEEHKVEIEKSIYFAMADLMNADVDLIFYDTTSLHFEVDEEDEGEQRKWKRQYAAQRKRGHSKNGRDDAPQVVVGLAVTREGLPVRSWVFAGNTADVSTVKQIREDLRGWRLGRCVFVGDAGMNSEENRRQLALGGGKYILATRLRANDEVTRDVLARAGRYSGVSGNLRVKEVIVGDGERRQRYIVCHNPQEQERQRKHRERLVAELEAELETMQQKPGRHSKRACELLSSTRFGRYLRQTKTGLLRLDRKAVSDAARYDGKWVITSNDDTLSAEDLALGYKQLMRVEECWRQLKTGLRMRPVFHWRPWRIHAHISIAVLALLLERIAELRVSDTWRNIAAALQTVKVVEYEHGGARVQQTTELPDEIAKLFTALKVPAPPRIHSVEATEVGEQPHG